MKEEWIFRDLPFHLKQAGRFDDLYQLLNEDWVNAKYSHYGTHSAVLGDFELAMRAALSQNPANWPQFYKSLFREARISEVNSSIPIEVIWYLTSTGEHETAVELVDLFASAPAAYTSAITHLAREIFKKNGDTAQARRILNAAASTVRRQDVDAWFYDDLSKIASTMAEIGLCDEAEELLERVYSGISTTPEDSLGNKTRATLSIASSIASAGLQERARSFLQLALEPTTLAFSLRELGGASISMILAGLAEAFLNIGDLQTAMDISHLVFDSTDHGSILEAIISRLVCSDVDSSICLLLAREIQDPIWKARALSAIAESTTRAGKAELALPLLNEAISALEQVKDEDERVEQQDSLAQVILTLSRLGRVKQATEIAETPTMLINIARGLAERGQIDLAKQVFHKGLADVEAEWRVDTRGSRLKISGWIGLCEALMEIGDIDRAKSTLETVLSSTEHSISTWFYGSSDVVRTRHKGRQAIARMSSPIDVSNVASIYMLVRMIAIALAKRGGLDEALGLVDKYKIEDKDVIYASIWIAVGDLHKASHYIKNIEEQHERLMLQTLVQVSGGFDVAFDLAISTSDIRQRLSSVEQMLNAATSENCRADMLQLDAWFTDALNDKSYANLNLSLLLCSAKAKLFLRQMDRAQLLLDEAREVLSDTKDLAYRVTFRAHFLGLAKLTNDEAQVKEAIQSLLADAQDATTGTLIQIVPILLSIGSVQEALASVREILRDRYLQESDALTRPQSTVQTPDQALEFVTHLQKDVEVASRLVECGLCSEAIALLRRLIERLHQLPTAPTYDSVKAEIIIKIGGLLIQLNELESYPRLVELANEPGDQAQLIAPFVEALVRQNRLQEARSLLIKATLLARRRFQVAIKLFSMFGAVLPQLCGPENILPICDAIEDAEREAIFSHTSTATDSYLELVPYQMNPCRKSNDF